MEKQREAKGGTGRDAKKYSDVALVATSVCAYPKKDQLFYPGEYYPVREAFHLLKLDIEHYGTPEWNPLGAFIKPGNTVLIKPNLVMEKNVIDEGTDCLYTQPSVVAPVIDYALLAMEGKGKIIIGDAPMQECRFETLISESGYADLIRRYQAHGYQVELVDFRGLTSEVRTGIRVQTVNQDAKGRIVDLGNASEFAGQDSDSLQRMRITNYDPDALKTHHTVDRHEYFISEYVLNADCIINMPKPKTHRKAGVTISLKNFVGINVRKEFLPHHTIGTPADGGDEYLNKSAVHALRSKLVDRRNHASAHGKYGYAMFLRCLIHACSLLMKPGGGDRYAEGSWYGNRTISRTISDLNKIAFYADREGKMQKEPQRAYLIVADMIVCGEKEGPVAPSRKDVGMIAAGTNPVYFDEAICALMGFNPEKIPAICTARSVSAPYTLADAETQAVFCSNSERYHQRTIEELDPEDRLHFLPTGGWEKYLTERES